MVKIIAAVSIVAFTLFFPIAVQAAEVGIQSYWVLQPEFGVLFLSVRSWPLSGIAIAVGMGEAVWAKSTRPSLNARVLWKFRDLGEVALQTAVGLIISYRLADSPMPIFESIDLLWTMELEYPFTGKGRLSIGVGIPIGWDPLAATIGIGFHLRY